MAKGPVTGTQIKDGRYYRVVAEGKKRRWIKLTRVDEGMPAFLRALKIDRQAFTRRVITTQDGQPYTYSGAQTAWKRAVKRSGIKGLTFNDLRAKAITDTDRLQGRAAANAKGAHSTEGQTMDYIRHKTARKTGATK